MTLLSRNRGLLLEQVQLDRPVSRPDCRPDDALDETEAAAKGSGAGAVANTNLVKKGNEANNTIEGKHQFCDRFQFTLPRSR